MGETEHFCKHDTKWKICGKQEKAAGNEQTLQSHWSRLFRLNSRLNKSLVKWIYFHIPVMILWDCRVGNWTLPNLPWSGKDGVTVEKLPSTLGKFTVRFISLISFLQTISPHSFLGRCSSVVIENAVSSAKRSNWFDKQRACESQMKFPTLAELRAPFSFLDGFWALMDAVMAVMKRGKNLTKSKPFLWTFFFYVLTCSVSTPTPNNGDAVTHAAS